jgi:ABC-type iron transport system FetAB permease component
MLSDMENDEMDRDAAAAQLAALQADRAALADRVLQPWWYDVCLGLLLFGFLASYAFDSLWVTFPALVVFFAGLGALVAAYKRITGVWVSASSRVMWVWGALVVVVLVPAFVLAEGYDQHWAMVVAGAVLGIAVGVLSRRWGRAYVAELKAGL